MLSESARMSTAAEARFRIQAPPDTNRAVKVIDLDSQECVSLLREYIRANPAVWNEDIGLG